MTRPEAPRIAPDCGHAVLANRPIKNGLCPACVLVTDFFENADFVAEFSSKSAIELNAKGGSS